MLQSKIDEMFNQFLILKMLHVGEVFQERQRFAETFSVLVRPTHPVHHRFTLTISLQWKAVSLVTTNEKLSAHREDEVAAPVLSAVVEDFQVIRKNKFQLRNIIQLTFNFFQPTRSLQLQAQFPWKIFARPSRLSWLSSIVSMKFVTVCNMKAEIDNKTRNNSIYFKSFTSQKL